MAPTRRVMAASLGKMPTTSVRRLISPLRRSSGLIEWIFGAMILWEAHEGEDVSLSVIRERGELRHFGRHLIRNLAPLLASRVRILLDEGRADEHGNNTTALAA